MALNTYYNPYENGMIPPEVYVAVTPNQLTNKALITRNGVPVGKITKISAPTKTGLSDVHTFLIGAVVGGIVMGLIVYGVAGAGAKYVTGELQKRTYPG